MCGLLDADVCACVTARCVHMYVYMCMWLVICMHVYNQRHRHVSALLCLCQNITVDSEEVHTSGISQKLPKGRGGMDTSPMGLSSH